MFVGLSRKSMVGALLSKDGAPRDVADRASGSVGLALAAVQRGASWLRVHDVKDTCDALTTYLAAMPELRAAREASCPRG